MSRITLRSPVTEEFSAFSAEKSAGDGNAVIVPLPLERIINDVQPTQDAVKNRPQDGMIDAPRNGDGNHAPETPTTNARRPASIFHFSPPYGRRWCHARIVAATPRRRKPVLCGIRLALRKRLIREANSGATNSPGWRPSHTPDWPVHRTSKRKGLQKGSGQLRSPVTEEFLAFSAEKTADDGSGVIALLEDKPAGNQTSSPLVVFRAALAAVGGNIFLGNAVDDRADSGPHAGASAHGTGFVRGVEHEVGQVTAVAAGYVLERFQLYVLDA